MMKFIFDRVENIVGKGENAGYPTFYSACPSCILTLLNDKFYYSELKEVADANFKLHENGGKFQKG